MNLFLLGHVVDDKVIIWYQFIIDWSEDLSEG